MRGRAIGWIVMVGWMGVAAALASAASAQTAPDPRDRASFQVVVTREVENDWATARLSAMAEGKDPAAVAAEVNARMQKALARAKKEKGIEVESGGYVTQPIYDVDRPGPSSVGDDGKSRIVRWQAWQELRLESADVDRLSKLIGALQEEQLALSGIDFSVKRETREALEDELTLEALRKFRARADLVAKGMEGKGWSLVAVSVGQGGGQPRYSTLMRADMAMKSAPAPAFEAGKSEIQVTVDGTIQLD